jgi:hypothetical protein
MSSDEYKNKFWRKHHDMKDLSKKVEELEMKIAIYENKIFIGTIERLPSNKIYGHITCSSYDEPIKFNLSNCNFNISNTHFNKQVKFKITINNVMEAMNIDLVHVESPYDLIK